MSEQQEAMAPKAPPGPGPEAAPVPRVSRPEGAALKRQVQGLLVRLAVFAALLWLLLGQVYLITRASGGEMFPAVKDGDLLVGYRLQKSWAKNDVVVYMRSGSLQVGRVLARGGDVVTIDDSGAVEVNGSAQSGEILYPTYPKSLLRYPYTVPADSLFVLGDCRTQARDSRDFGPVPCTQVKAKVITLIRRRGL